MSKKNVALAVVALVIALYAVFKLMCDKNADSDYIAVEPIAEHNNGTYFSGSTICAECHLEIYTDHLETAHYNSSGKAHLKSIKGSFKPNKNVFELNDSIAFRMNIRNKIPYQDIFFEPKDSLVDSLRFDVFIGSGTKGQTYLNWRKNALYQLQVSYFTPSNSWVNSPGYPTSRLASIRPIFERCLECHVTHAKKIQIFGKRNVYEKPTILYGIDCERCHGPSYEHVTFHKKNPKATVAKNMRLYSDLSRQQKLDACALCHSGVRMGSNNNAFAFVTGDTLKQFSMPDYDEKSIKNLDVHGNQYGLLSASECFKKSDTMNCITCHNPHKKERNDHVSFNRRCQECHDKGLEANIACAETMQIKAKADNNCIQCHMPLAPSKSMRIETPQKILKSVEVRTHLIGIYPDSIIKFEPKIISE